MRACAHMAPHGDSRHRRPHRPAAEAAIAPRPRRGAAQADARRDRRGVSATSARRPLYALQATLDPRYHLGINVTDLYGIVSLIFWSFVFVVTIKYVFIVMRCDNHGEGGSLALYALIQRRLGAACAAALAADRRAVRDRAVLSPTRC